MISTTFRDRAKAFVLAAALFLVPALAAHAQFPKAEDEQQAVEESAPGVKSPERIQQFISATRQPVQA